MIIKKFFEYDLDWDEIADEFIANDSALQSQILNRIGETFKRWAKDEMRTATYIQLLEIAEDLDDDGEWFVKTLYKYMGGATDRHDIITTPTIISADEENEE